MKYQKEIEELSTRELQEEILKSTRINQKALRSIDGSTSFLFWLGILGLIGAIINVFR